ncbi:hypothetical protein B0A49_08953 [Cryomyces minteri]|uniref:Endonuclease/exonuclease/phosphatase domain-containing protein n=1 Tax=Cryomyces minteri TaxID=331657 RepID=A0A4U0WJN3_9PEZI|nr:hypothetical protein B0A49_08953 [Cryomyces minteri]
MLQSTLSSLASSIRSKLASPPPQEPVDFYAPRRQPWYMFDSTSRGWKEAPGWQKDSPVTPASTVAGSRERAWDGRRIDLITWNIDVLIPCGHIRMTAALSHLQRLILPQDPEGAQGQNSNDGSQERAPVVVFLQEMSPDDLALIASTPWIREHFNVTDTKNTYWDGKGYGTTSLVDRRLDIAGCFRVMWVSRFERDGLFVDVLLPPSASASASASSKTEKKDNSQQEEREGRRTLRLCNTHLESLVADPPFRPQQVAAASRHLHAPDVHAGVLAGDCNAIEPFDRTLAAEHGLSDVFLTLGGREDSEEGFTWGYQSGARVREKFGCSRMDKVLVCGGVVARGLERVGVGVRVSEGDRAEMRGHGLEEGWVTDHYGLNARLEIVNEQEIGRA